MKDYIKCKLCAAVDEMPQTELAELCGERLHGVLTEIAAVLADASNDDFACVENIITILEKYGCGCGGRHDF